MLQKKKVVLYGSSIFIAGLEASLKAVSGLEIQRVELQRDDSLDRLLTEAPDVIVIELGISSGDQAFSLLKAFPGVALIGLDTESNRLLVLSMQQESAMTTADLVQVIQRQPIQPQDKL
jgi:DNA-binding NarL/FixJ family response regulator